MNSGKSLWKLLAKNKENKYIKTKTKDDNLEGNKDESFKSQLISYFEKPKLHNIYCGFKKGQLHFDLENIVYDKNSNQYYITVEFELKNDGKINENRISLFPKMKGIESMMTHITLKMTM